MVQYYPGPYEVEIVYSDAGLEHKQRLNCNITVEGPVGDPFSAFTVEQRNGVSIALNVAVDAYVTLMRGMYAASANFLLANLYKYVPNSYDKSFLAVYDINQLGTGGGTTQLNHYTMLTFNTQLGNNVKYQFMEDNLVAVDRIAIRDAAVPQQNMANYLVGATNWTIARDGSFPAGKLNRVGGQNEALFKHRNR